MEGKIIFKGESKRGKPFLVRYPKKSDAKVMTDYINTLSDEKTYITYQGERETLISETNYLNSQLEKIENKQAVQLLAFTDKNLIGVTGIDLQKRTSSHEGILGISVAKEFRGEGIGKKLMELVMAEAIKELSGLRIISLALFGNNPLAQNMYKKFGFKEYGRLPKGLLHRGIYIDHIFMYKEV